ncbi:iron-containing alcohol dehydrogenase [Edaphobacter dinghuensis]|uniref:Alcohol dehydrogenase n=2 Tax=Edaphobacter dinghuensis TaxID=1560005 RepID=A0A917HMQ0_9BACT|nr:iron-containing alcohol dehydrogenase [Edaphobacter dinghuensis]GGG84439.1 alcohol dehydrogenase [Edaphobacter dinghuensis]
MPMRTITLLQPNRLVFGSGCLTNALDYLSALPQPRIHIVYSASLHSTIDHLKRQLSTTGIPVTSDRASAGEPTLSSFHAALERARATEPTCILGIGGGSALDLAKLLAAFLHNAQRIEDTFGIGLLRSRNCHLVCIPSTSGTGSEVSPNAILLDETAQIKKGVISPCLVPDATFIDPTLTHSVPPAVTAFTGLDALTHCIEAYTNKHAHSLVDLYALEGIRLCARFLARATHDGNDAEAREGLSLASLYGGLCLGPVNTAAVHALAYPLGGEFHIPHGLSNAILLSTVFRFNAAASPERHADVALALGAELKSTPLETAYAGAAQLEALTRTCNIDTNLAHHGIGRNSISHLAEAALTVQRLLSNNPRELTRHDVEQIYAACFA